MKQKILKSATGLAVAGGLCWLALAPTGTAAPAADPLVPGDTLAVLRKADTGTDRRAITGFASQLSAPASSPFESAGAERSAPASRYAIDVAASRTSAAPGSVQLAPTVDGKGICATSTLPAGDVLGSCSLTRTIAPGATGAFMSSRPAPGSSASSRVVGIVGDDVSDVAFLREGGRTVSVKPIDNVVTLDASTLPTGATVSHTDGSTVRIDF